MSQEPRSKSQEPGIKIKLFNTKYLIIKNNKFINLNKKNINNPCHIQFQLLFFQSVHYILFSPIKRNKGHYIFSPAFLLFYFPTFLLFCLRLTKKPRYVKTHRDSFISLATTYSPAIAVPLALTGLTSLFGMGRGGTLPL